MKFIRGRRVFYEDIQGQRKKGNKNNVKNDSKEKASANMENERENQVIISEALNKLQKALTVLQVTIENYELGKTGLITNLSQNLSENFSTHLLTVLTIRVIFHSDKQSS